MKKFLLALFCVSFITSCTLEKRLYRKGFYVSHPGNVLPEKIDNEKVIIDCKLPQSPSANTVTEKIVVREIVSQNVVNEKVKSFIPAQKKRLHSKLLPPVKSPGVPVNITPEHKSPPNETGMSSKSMVLLGWIFVGLALVSLLVLWPMIFFAIPGGILLAMGYKRKGGREDAISEFKDVVYLKNGSVIKGVVVEQVPGVSLKIRTSDGSVFFYKMEDVEKMTKE